jgi:hypothetical protein
MTADERRRRAKAIGTWRQFNPLARRLAGIAPKLIRVAFDPRVE